MDKDRDILADPLEQSHDEIISLMIKNRNNLVTAIKLIVLIYGEDRGDACFLKQVSIQEINDKIHIKDVNDVHYVLVDAYAFVSLYVSQGSNDTYKDISELDEETLYEIYKYLKNKYGVYYYNDGVLDGLNNVFVL